MVSTLVSFSGSTCQPCLANLDGPQLQLLYQGWSLSLGFPPPTPAWFSILIHEGIVPMSHTRSGEPP